MAPTVRAVGAQANTSNAGGTSVSVPLPTGTAANDILILVVETGNEPITVSGYSNVGAGIAQQATAPATALTVKWKRAVGGEAAPTVSGTGINHIVARIIGVTGCPTIGDPFSGTPAFNINSTSNTSVSVPGTTALDDDVLAFAVFSTGTDVTSTTHASAWANANLANVTVRMNNWHVTGNGGGFSMMTGTLATAGAIGNSTATIATAATKALASFALKAPVSAPAIPPSFVVSRGL